MNPLDDHPAARRIAYTIQFVVAGLIFLTGVGLSAADVDWPRWYTVTCAVSGALWSYLGLTAAKHTPRPDRGDRGAVDAVTALVIAVLVVVLLILIGVVPVR